MLYRPGDDVGTLDDWPFDKTERDYRILSGAPSATVRLDSVGPAHVTRRGIWRCTVGTFECTELGDELMTLLRGRCCITDQATGETVSLEAADTYMIRDGTRVTWDIQEDVTKVFFAHKAGGY